MYLIFTIGGICIIVGHTFHFEDIKLRNNNSFFGGAIFFWILSKTNILNIEAIDNTGNITSGILFNDIDNIISENIYLRNNTG